MVMPNSPVISTTVPPGRVDFSSVAAVQAAVPGLRLPRNLPPAARFANAQFWYPPRLVFQEQGGQTVLTATDYNIPPTLERGHVVLNYTLPNGMLAIDQGRLASLANPNSSELGPAMTRRLPNGRTVHTREARGPQFPPTGIRVVAWRDDVAGNRIAAYSTSLSIDELAAIMDSIP